MLVFSHNANSFIARSFLLCQVTRHTTVYNPSHLPPANIYQNTLVTWLNQTESPKLPSQILIQTQDALILIHILNGKILNHLTFRGLFCLLMQPNLRAPMLSQKCPKCDSILFNSTLLDIFLI